MRNDLIVQLLITKWLLLKIHEERSNIETWLSANDAYRDDIKNILPILDTAGFAEALREIPGNCVAMDSFLKCHDDLEEQLIQLLHVQQKKSAKDNSVSVQRVADLTDVAAAWYKHQPPLLTSRELENIKAFLDAQAKRNGCCFGVNILGGVSPLLAKFILDTPSVFSQVAADTVPFGAEPILTIGLQAGYCEQKYAEHKFFVERFLQFAGDTTAVARPASGIEVAPAHAIRTILARTAYYKLIQMAFASDVIRSAHILCEATRTSPLLMKLVDQIIKPENHPTYRHRIDKSAEARYLLAWDRLPWIGDEKILQLASVAFNTRNAITFLHNVPTSIRILFINNSQNARELKIFIEIQPDQSPDIIFAYLARKDLWHTLNDTCKSKLLWQLLIPMSREQHGMYVEAWLNLLSLRTDKTVLTLLQITFRRILPPENVNLTAVKTLLSPLVIEQAENIANYALLWLLGIQLIGEGNNAEAAVLFHVFADHPQLGRKAKEHLNACATAEAQAHSAQKSFFSFWSKTSTPEITARFYCALHDNNFTTLQELFGHNISRYMQLLTIIPLSYRAAQLLADDRLIEVPHRLANVEDKAAVMKQVCDYYLHTRELPAVNILEPTQIAALKNDHFSWLVALLCFYTRRFDIAGQLFNMLSCKTNCYTDLAKKYALNCPASASSGTGVTPLSDEQQERLAKIDQEFHKM